MDKILDQGNRKNCGIYGVMAILQHMGVNFDIAMFQDEFAPYINQIEKLFVASGLVKQFIKIPTTRLVDLWLRKGEYLLTGTNLGDFTLEDNVGGLVEFDGKSQHWFIIVENCGDKYKLQNSWSDSYGEKGYMYMKKSDFKMLFAPRRIVANKNIGV